MPMVHCLGELSRGGSQTAADGRAENKTEREKMVKLKQGKYNL